MSRAVERDRVYVAARGQVFAFDAATGRVIWRSSTGSSMFGGAIASIIVVGDRLVVGRHGHVTALDKHTGRRLWTQSLPGTAWATPLLATDVNGTQHAAAAAAEQQQQQQRDS